jgi:hypothetical protein
MPEPEKSPLQTLAEQLPTLLKKLEKSLGDELRFPLAKKALPIRIPIVEPANVLTFCGRL